VGDDGEDGKDDSEVDGEDEGEDGDGDSDSDGDADNFGQEKTYPCPELECQQRKADSSFKKYSRHYKTRTISTCSRA
jgi:hypothetical protein